MKISKNLKFILMITFSLLLLATIIISIVLTVKSNYLKDLNDKNDSIKEESNVNDLPMDLNSFIKKTR